MREPSRSAGGSESLAEFLTAVRRPLEFLASASASTVARTRLPGRELARRGRTLETDLAGNSERELVRKLCEFLERYETTPPDDQDELIQRCREILSSLAAPGGRRADYRVSGGDVHAALDQLRRAARYVRGVGPRRAEELQKFGVETIEDLLYHLPFRYEDRRRIARIAQAKVGEETSVLGELLHLKERIVGRGRRRILEGALRDETGLLGLTWYHQVMYFRTRYRIGQRYLVYGRVERLPGGGKRIVHPEIDSAEEGAAGIVPVYNKPVRMTVATMRKLVQQAVQDFAALAPSVIPPAVAGAAKLVDVSTALQAVHRPETHDDVTRLNRFRSVAHRALVFDELFFLQLGMNLRKRSASAEAGLTLRRRGDLTDRLAGMLPFSLTGAQRRVLGDIYRDMGEPHPMHRLMQGDVGSGKTIVALFAALVAIENGYQAAFMAPTELLAEQHFHTMSKFVPALGLTSVLLTGETVRSKRTQLYEELAGGRIQLVVGTHALIQESVRMPALGLGVIDEQHRFGVLQRAALRRLCGDETQRAPDILLMTATPIPRTLTMTVYGDLDVSLLDELPPGRKAVRTLILTEAERRRAYQLVKRELDAGHQGYVVYPLVEASEKEDLRDATTMARELSSTVFSEYRVGLIHGRMKSEEKDAVMRRFRVGDLQLLVSTTVVEVGVDVPNATMMLVEHADRFGLSQLHQLRGRVGRGGDDATCLLIAPYHQGIDTRQRLEALRGTTDGFEIAEIDLRLRGPGEFLGTRQSGLPDFRVTNLIRDSRLLAEARQAADAWLTADPALTRPESAALRAVLEHRWAGRLGLADIG